jgi:hypothetical protein
MTDANGAEYEGDTYDPEPEPEPAPVDEPMSSKPPPVIPLGEVTTEDSLPNNEISYTRQVNLGSRDDNAWIKLALQFPTQPGWDMDQLAVQAVNYGNVCVSVVSEMAGLPVMMTDSGMIREAIRTNFPDAEDVTPEQDRPKRKAAAPRRQERTTPRSSHRYPAPAELEMPERVDEDDWADLCENPDDWYDNRADKANGKGPARGPDFRHKRDGTGIWLTAYVPEPGDRRRR